MIVVQCCHEIERRGLSDVGLYRVSGNQTVVKQLREAFIKNPRLVNVCRYCCFCHVSALSLLLGSNKPLPLVQLSTDVVVNISSIAAVLKLYLRELSEPLFTSALYATFIQVGRTAGTVEQLLPVYRAALRKLPKANFDTVVYLFDHFHRVCQKAAVNLMTPASLATCLGPTLLTPAEVWAWHVCVWVCGWVRSCSSQHVCRATSMLWRFTM
jgi:hypothetical protein